MTPPAVTRFTASLNSLWYRVPVWAVIIASSVAQAHGTGRRLATALLMTGAATALQFAQARSSTARRVAVLATTVLGLAACFTAPSGFAYILVAVAATRVSDAVDGRPLLVVTVLDTLAFGATVALASHSAAGALAGLGIPLLVQRAVEHRDLARERDRATALLAEVRRGQESEARAAALQERGRIAREMHDVLAHSLAGLSVQLQAVRAVAAREQVGPAVLEPIDRAATLAREGLAEARSAVSTLREPVVLGLAAVPALVQRHPGSARLVVEGTPGSVADDAGHAVYRAVQESLTNAVRYAPGSDVLVTMTWRPARLAVTVQDTGPDAGPAPAGAVGTGLGLAGMAERLAAAGGTVHAGPDGSGWCVRLEVPVAVSDPADAPDPVDAAGPAEPSTGSASAPPTGRR